MTWEESITVEERKVVEELKRRTIKDVTPKMLEDESLFYRFSKARNFNVDDAEAMLTKHIAWRKEFQIDTILTDYKPPEVLEKYLPTSFVCFTKEGYLVRFIDLGQIDVKGLMNSAAKIDIYKMFFRIMEEDFAATIKHGKEIGKQVTKECTIYNMEHLTFAKATNRKYIELAICCFKSYQDNYPEFLKVATIINASSIFSFMFPLIKAILASEIIEKLRCYSTDSYKEYFLEEIDAEDLPAFLGGNKTDPDGNPLCKSFINHGQEIPKSYYRCENKKTFSSSSDVEKLTIKRLSKEELSFEVKEAGLDLEWEFETETKDIEFSVYFKDKSLEDNKPQEVVPKQRIDTYFESQKGLLKCEQTGTYTFVFNNSYSWMHSKEVYYRVRLRSQGDEEN